MFLDKVIKKKNIYREEDKVKLFKEINDFCKMEQNLEVLINYMNN